MNESRKGFQTRAIHAGESADPETGASAPNLVMSTTFTSDKPHGFSFNDVADNPDGNNETPYVYTRWGNPTVNQLEAKLADLEDAEAGLAFASGMAASTALLLTTLSAGDHLVISDVNYAGTAELVRDTLPRLNIDVTPVDTRNLDSVTAAIRPTTRLVWIETPANPILRIIDIRAVAEIAHAAGALLAVDSTFATPVATRPLTKGADYVVHSLTKYIGGHGDALGGAVLASRSLIDALRGEGIIHFGGVISPFNAWLILRGIATLPLRMRAHQENAFAVARFLEDHPKVGRVLYPGLPSHPEHELATRQMDNYSGMVSFQTRTPDLATRMAQELKVIHYAVSLGHQRSLIYWIATDEIVGAAYRLSGQALERYRAVAGDGLFRLSVGLEDPEDLCEDLARVLD